ncbi:MAG: HPr family phosphocarrier protein [Eubacteriales bacterium]|nr:HPr family phosphocarrier protein [Eubacteriales bacterium]
MRSFTYIITDPVGIHARPAGLLVKQVKNYKSTITIERGEKEANAQKMMALMGLCVKKGDTVRVKAEGADEEQAATELETWFREHL